jgi:hypothetical protein
VGAEIALARGGGLRYRPFPEAARIVVRRTPKEPLMRTAIVLAFALLLAGCASGVSRPMQEVTARVEPDSVQRVRLVAHSYYFEPNRIVLKAHVPAELIIHNAALFVPHGFVCRAPEGGLDLKAKLGMFHGTKRLRFVPGIPGEYSFYCPVGSHMKHGMTGTLAVVP